MPRPLSVTLVAWLFIVVGGAGLLDALRPLVLGMFDASRHGLFDFALVVSIRALAVVGGTFVLAGANWARWLLAGWMAGHVALSLGHSWSEALMHPAIFSVLGYFLFRPRASRFFRVGRT